MSTGNDGPADASGRRYVFDVKIPGPMLAEAARSGGGSAGSEGIPLPPCTPVGTDDYRARIDHSKVDDTIIEELYSDALAGGTGGDFDHHRDRIVLHVVRRGQWQFERPGHHTRVAAPAGRFVVRNNDRSWRFEIAPRTSAKVFVLPAANLRNHIGSRVVTGAADAAEVRLLMAHAQMIEATLDELSPAGLQTARAALVELAKGVLTQGVDGNEPLLAPALAQAAKDLVDDLLTRPGLAPSVLARHLSVSIRTLHRAFADTDESVTAYIRRRRLERARLDLATADTLSISEIAARWQFADASHFARAFKAEYGQSPTQFARSTRLSATEQGDSPAIGLQTTRFGDH